jgi:hypothetical protein
MSILNTQLVEKQYYAAGQTSLGPRNAIDHDPTVEENLDLRINSLKAEIARLEKSKETLGPLLPMRISDIRSAMNY